MKYDNESGSFYTDLAKGCKHCLQGEKMVLFITGLCHRKCFYCPVSTERNNNDVIFANERPVLSEKDVLDEARSMNAVGTGITGGEPLLVLERVLGKIELLKQAFGPSHHIHLYTSQSPGREVLQKLKSAGLDEMRFHPPPGIWEKLYGSEYARSIECAGELGISAGIEIPAIQGVQFVADFADKNHIFLNLNELEFSHTNSDELKKRGFSTFDDESCAAAGSMELALGIMEQYSALQVHFCSSRFKDAVQLRKRLQRTAGETAREFDEITPDGTLFYGVLQGDADEIVLRLKHLNVPDHLFESCGTRVEVGWWVLQEIAALIVGFEAWYEECYPTFGRMVVERIPLDTSEIAKDDTNFYLP